MPLAFFQESELIRRYFVTAPFTTGNIAKNTSRIMELTDIVGGFP
jgi:hypothetical protein